MSKHRNLIIIGEKKASSWSLFGMKNRRWLPDCVKRKIAVLTQSCSNKHHRRLDSFYRGSGITLECKEKERASGSTEHDNVNFNLHTHNISNHSRPLHRHLSKDSQQTHSSGRFLIHLKVSLQFLR